MSRGEIVGTVAEGIPFSMSGSTSLFIPSWPPTFEVVAGPSSSSLFSHVSLPEFGLSSSPSTSKITGAFDCATSSILSDISIPSGLSIFSSDWMIGL